MLLADCCQKQNRNSFEAFIRLLVKSGRVSPPFLVYPSLTITVPAFIYYSVGNVGCGYVCAGRLRMYLLVIEENVRPESLEKFSF